MNIAIYISLFFLKNKIVKVYRSQSSPKQEIKYNQYSKLFFYLAKRTYQSADYVIAQGAFFAFCNKC